MTQPDPAVTIRLLDVYTEQVKIGGQLALIQEQLKSIPDHESRLRSLEKWRYSLPFAMLAGVGSAALSVWSVLHR